MADIFNEIDEELRRDKAQEWWSRYGKIVIAVCVVIVLGAAGYTWYEQQRVAEERALADRFDAARVQAEAGDLSGAAGALEALADEAGVAGVELVARFHRAGLLGTDGDHAGAAEAYAALSQDSAVPALYRDLATVMEVLHAGRAGGDRAELLDRLQPMTVDASPWRHTARMIAASLAIGAGDLDAAKEYLRQVADDPQAPGSARGQSAEILQALGS